MAANVQASIQLVDRMSGPLQTIITVLNTMVTGLEHIDSEMGQAFSPDDISSMRSQLGGVETELTGIVEQIEAEKNAVDRTNSSVQQQSSLFGGVTSQIKGMITAYAGIQGIKATFGFYKESVEGANKQIEAESKLATVMNQRMGATQNEINLIKQLASEQQGIGVVGDEVQLAGAQQLATFLNTDAALQKLIPAMNNLAVQQNGVGVTSENLVGIGNMMGKVMQGQTAALTRVGVTFTEAQEQALKYGNEEERAATLAQVITDNVGQMNAVMAATPEGKLTQINNTWGDMKETVGMQLYPAILDFFDALNTGLPAIEPMLQGITAIISTIVYGFSYVVSFIGNIASFVQSHSEVFGPLALGLGAIVIGLIAYKAALGLVTIAQKAYNVVVAANPIMIVVIALTMAVAGLIAFCNWIAKMTGVTKSGFGIICGIVASAGAVIYNTIVGVVNSIIQCLWTVLAEPFIGIIEWILNACNGGFNSFGDAVKNLIGNIISWFLSLGKVVTKIIDAIFGTDWTGGLNTLQNDVLAWGKNEKAITISRDAPEIPLQRIAYSTAFNAGANFGDNISQGISDFFSGDIFNPEDMYKNLGNTGLNSNGESSDISDLANGTDATAKNTEKIAENTEKTNSLIDLIKDNWEREIIAKYTASKNSINIDMSNMTNTYNNTQEAFNMAEELARHIKQQMNIQAEGV